MSGMYINIPLPDFEQGCRTITIYADGVVTNYAEEVIGKAVPVPDHGRLGDLDELRKVMYHEAFETDSPMQKWDSGCWIRYKMFENAVYSAPVIIPGEEVDDGA